MDCPDTHKDVIAQLCGLHYYPGVGCNCASAAACNHHFRRWLKTEPEVQRLHQEYLAKKEKPPMIDIIAVKTAVNRGELAVKIHNGNILLGYPKAGEWVKIGETEATHD